MNGINQLITVKTRVCAVVTTLLYIIKKPSNRHTHRVGKFIKLCGADSALASFVFLYLLMFNTYD